MLQAHRSEIRLAWEEYNAEFIKDMSTAESLVRPTEPKQKEQPADESSGSSDVDTLELDPTKSSQRWKKTGSGWEDESPESPLAKEEKKEPPPPWAKKLYKKIALASHPDRTSADHRHESLKRIFQDSAAALSKGDFEELINFALQLDIEIEDIGVDIRPILKKRIELAAKEISEIESSLQWLWGETLGAPEVRSGVLAAYFHARGIDVNNIDLVDIIRKIEGDNASGKDS